MHFHVTSPLYCDSDKTIALVCIEQLILFAQKTVLEK